MGNVEVIAISILKEDLQYLKDKRIRPTDLMRDVVYMMKSKEVLYGSEPTEEPR